MATALSNLLALLALDESAYLKGLESSQKATDNFGTNLANAGGAIVVGALTIAATAVVGIGTAAFDAAETVDEAFDSIQVATGATGDELGLLKEDFKAVFADVPAEAGVVADVIGILNSRLGITGPALQDVATPLLELSRILGGDATQYAEDFTRVLGDWNIPTEDAAGSLDSLFVAAQETGAPIDTLMQQIVQYGAPLRNFGFGFEEAGALLSSFAAEGVNTEIVMSGLRIAQGKFITQGKDMKTGLWESVDAIQNAATQTDALAIATEIFGAKAAGDMVDTIRAGKFDLEGLTTAMQNADGAILTAADATTDWGEKWKMFQNKMTIALAPLGEKLREAFGSAIDTLIEVFNRPDVQSAITKFADFAVLAIGKLVEYIPIVIDGFFAFIDFLKQNEGILIGVFVALAAAALVWAGSAIAAAASTIVAMLPVIAVIALIGLAAYLLYEAWTNNWGGIQEITATAIANIQTFIQGVVDFFIAVWQNPLVQTIVQTLLSNITALFAAFKAAFSGDWYAFGENIRVIWDNNWKLIGTILSTAWGVIKNIFKTAVANIINIFRTTNWGELGRNIAEGIARGITSAVGAIVKAAQSAASAALEAAKGFLGIKSPSTVFEMEVGYMMGAGVAEGWMNSIQSLLAPSMDGLSPDALGVQPQTLSAAPASVTGNGSEKEAMLYEELIRLMRDLPDDIARAIRTSQAKGRVTA